MSDRQKTTVRDVTIEDVKGIAAHINNPKGDVEFSGGTMRRVNGIGFMIGEGPNIDQLLTAIEGALPTSLDHGKRHAIEAAIAETRTAPTDWRRHAALGIVRDLTVDIVSGTLAALLAQRLGG